MIVKLSVRTQFLLVIADLIVLREIRMRRGRRTIVVVCLLIAGLATGIVNMVSEEASAYTPHGQIRILSDSDFTPANGVISGNGTEINPYIIAGWEIDAEGGDGIKISQTTSHFIIRDCFLYHGDSRFTVGIWLTNVLNGRIQGVALTEMGRAIALTGSHNNTISNSHLYKNRHGVYLGGSDNNVIKNNNVSSGRWGIYLGNSENNRIVGNVVYDNLYGVEISLADSRDNIVTHNDILRNGVSLEGGGVLMSGSGANLIHHNNMTFNDPQASDDTSLNVWDDGYPSGGNCWTDDGGVDGYSGPNQDQPGEDGISDSPYVIDADSKDMYPMNIPSQGCGIEWNATSLTPHDPIHIQSDTEFTPENGVIGGSGKSTDPYIIEGWHIEVTSTSGDGINISYTDEYYVIRRVLVHGDGTSRFGISLMYTYSGRADQVTIIGNSIGISAYRAFFRVYNSNISLNSGDGIQVVEGDVWIENSTISSNGGDGYTQEWYFNKPSIKGCRITQNGGSGVVVPSGNALITDNNISLNSQHGIVAGSSAEVVASGNSIFQNGGHGIHLLGLSSGNLFERNTISYHDIGIFNDGEENLIANNTLIGNVIGIESYSFGSFERPNFLMDNTIESSEADIHLRYAGYNALFRNLMTGRGIRITGSYLEGVRIGSEYAYVPTHHIDSTNTVHGKPVYYLKNYTGGSVPSDGGQVFLVNSTGVTVENQNISNVHAGIVLAYSSLNEVKNNTLQDNTIGVEMVFSDDNVIYHNAFLNNTIQAREYMGTNHWDNGYPSGGNFWSDYTGVDNCSGPNQDICPDPDGIGDVPYTMSGGSEDRYPMMSSDGFKDVRPPIPEGQVNGPRTMGNITINRMRSRDGEGGIYAVRWLETLRSELSDMQALRPQPEPREINEIQKLEISVTQNKFQCPNVLSAKRN